MDVTPLIPQGKQVIHGYGDGGFTVTETRYEGDVVILPDNTLAWDGVSVAALQGADIEILLIGTGEERVQPDEAIIAYCREHGIVPEVMDTGAACRTYNVLLTEGRDVAALLKAV